MKSVKEIIDEINEMRKEDLEGLKFLNARLYNRY